VSEVLQAICQHFTPSPKDEIEKTRSISANLGHAQKQLRKAKQEAETLHCQHLEAVLNEALASNQ